MIEFVGMSNPKSMGTRLGETQNHFHITLHKYMSLKNKRQSRYILMGYMEVVLGPT